MGPITAFFLGVLASVVGTTVTGFVTYFWSRKAKRLIAGVKLGVSFAGIDEDALKRAGEVGQAGLRDRLLLNDSELKTIEKIKLQISKVARQTLESAPDQQIERALRLSEAQLDRIDDLKDVEVTLTKEDFYQVFSNIADRAGTEIVLVGEGVEADREDEKKQMTHLVEKIRKAVKNDVRVVRIQTRAIISEWWYNVLREMISVGGEHFSLYFGPTQFVYPCVVDSGDEKTACVEMMMPIATDGYVPETGSPVERAGVAVFVKRDKGKASYLAQKIRRSTDFAISIDLFEELISSVRKRRVNGKVSGRLTPEEVAIFDSTVRIKGVGELDKYYKITEDFRVNKP